MIFILIKFKVTFLNGQILKQIFFNDKIQKKKFINNTALNIAIEKGNNQIVRLLLDHPGIDVNVPKILKFIFFYNILKNDDFE